MRLSGSLRLQSKRQQQLGGDRGPGHAGDRLAPIEELDHPLDLVVSDVMMPGMKGPELVAALRDRQEGLPAVFITGYAEVSLEGALASGPSELLRKPVSPAELRKVVARLTAPGPETADTP